MVKGILAHMIGYNGMILMIITVFILDFFQDIIAFKDQKWMKVMVHGKGVLVLKEL